MRFSSKKLLKKLRKKSEKRQKFKEIKKQVLDNYRKENKYKFVSMNILFILLITQKSRDLFLIGYCFLNIIFFLLMKKENKKDDTIELYFLRIENLYRVCKKKKIRCTNKKRVIK